MKEGMIMYCRFCGKETPNGGNICPECANQPANNNGSKEIKFLPSFILGLMGSIFSFLGGFCTTICASFVSSSTLAFILIIGGSIVGLIGSCKCLKNAKVGSILEILAAIMIIVYAYGIWGSDLMTVIGMLMLLIGGIIGLVYSVVISKK